MDHWPQRNLRALKRDVITYQVDTPHIFLCVKKANWAFLCTSDYFKIHNLRPQIIGGRGSSFFSHTISVLHSVKIGHTANERRVLGSRSNFSPGASLWFSRWSSLSSQSFSKPSTTAILFPPRYLRSRKTTHMFTHTTVFKRSSQQKTTISQTRLLTVWRGSADWRDYRCEWCCCSACTDGWGWRQSRGCECAWADYHTGKGQWGFYTWRDPPEGKI